MTTRVGVDVGGTFTDLVAVSGDGIVTTKVPSTPRDQSEGVLAGLDVADVDAADVVAFAHGTTVATNALLERRGGRTALVTTDGFRDIIEIARQNRASLYDLTAHHPEPLVPRELRFTIVERMGPAGVIMPLDAASLAACVEKVRAANVEAVAVCLLFGYLHPEHEREVASALRSALDIPVIASHEVLPEFREYERMATTVADAYLRPKLATYLRRLGDSIVERSLPAPVVMRSSGGVVALEDAAERAAAAVLSGPAGGVVGAAFAARASGFADVLTFDMGGTSTDVAPVEGGRVATATDAVVAGVPIRFPIVDVHTVSAGGGSIAWTDDGGALRVGPHSAGAEPGPVAYGRGGTEPTVTDANLVLGYLGDKARLGDAIELDRARAEDAVDDLGDRLGLDVVATARGIVEVANEAMSVALRVVSVGRGLDPRDHALVAFGGAGPMHACALAEQLGMRTIVVPFSSGVLSALGLAIADERRDFQAPVNAAVDEVERATLEAAFEEMEGRARSDLSGAVCERRADVRYRGQSYELTIDASDIGHLADLFGSEHERRYGYSMDTEPIEVVNLRVIASVATEPPKLIAPEPVGDERGPRRRAWFDSEMDVDVWLRLGMGSGTEIVGPCIVEFPDATCVVRPGWNGTVDPSGNIVLEMK